MAGTADRHGPVSRWLHGLIALGILGLIGLGWWMVGLSYYDAWYHRALELHRAIGMIVLALAVGFHVWRLARPGPKLQTVLKPWERTAATVVHAVLLVAMVAIPATGYLVSTSENAGFPFFGLFDIPPIVAGSETLRELAIDIHFYLAYGLIGVVALHAGAALKHQFVDKHGTLRRMV